MPASMRLQRVARMRKTRFYSAVPRLRAEEVRGRYGACDNEGVDA